MARPFRWIAFLFAAALAVVASGLIFRSAGTAQQIARSVAFDPATLIAFVSNQDGDEDIYITPWDGWEGWDTPITPINRTPDDNAARDWAPAWSPDGTQIAFNSDRDRRDTIYIMNADGTRLRPLFPTGTSNDYAPAWAPDGARIAFTSDRAGLGRDLYVADLNGENVVQVTRNAAIKGDPRWTPDGASLTYWERQTTGVLQAFSIAVDAANARPTPLSFTNGATGMTFWSSSQPARLFYESNRDGGFFRVYSAEANGNRAAALTEAGLHSGRAAISPDNSLIVFTIDRDNSDELYLMNADGTGLERLTDNGWSDHSPAWQPRVPANTRRLQPTPAPTLAPTAAPAASGEGLGALGQSGLGFETHPINLQSLRDSYQITAWHQANWRGQGRKIGVIDLGFGGLSALEAALGRSVTLPLGEEPAEYDRDANDHGRRVLEVIAAVAPEASLYACRYDGSYAGFAECADALAIQQGVDVINHSAGLPLFPLDGQSSDWAKKVSDINDLNVLWVNSMGNFQQGFYSADFSDTDRDGLHEFRSGQPPVQKLDFNIPEGSTYRGNIILTWDTSRGFADLNIEVIDNQGSVVASTTTDPASGTVVPAKRLLLERREPFAVRVRAGQGQGGVVRMALVVEYLGIDSDEIPNTFRDRTGIAPADSRRVVSVGAVQTFDDGGTRRVDQLAPYSSFGLLDTLAYNKPDVMAYGDLEMPDGSLFVGTSASAPVVAAAMALYWQTNEGLATWQLRDEFFERAVYQSADYSVGTHGAGVMRLPPPPGRNGGDVGGGALPKIIFPQPDPEAAPVVAQCGGAPTRFSVGAEGYVNFNLGLFLRAEPAGTNQIGPRAGLQLGEQFTAIAGPRCAAGMSWWNIRLNDGSTGWVAEGEDYYLIAPSNLDQAQLTETFNTDCPNAPTMEVTIGERAIIDSAPSGGLTLWRRPNALSVIGGMGAGSELHILGGPVCVPGEGIRRWYVRVIEGNWRGNEGWTSEARPSQRWLVPWTLEAASS